MFYKKRQPEGDCEEFKAKLNGEIHIISFLGNFIVNVYRYDSWFLPYDIYLQSLRDNNFTMMIW